MSGDCPFGIEHDNNDFLIWLDFLALILIILDVVDTLRRAFVSYFNFV